VKNPNPFKRAYRMERRRKELGSSNPRCCYCSEADLYCLELDHPVTEKLDCAFTQVVCRNDHRKLEAERDIAGLTKNGLHDVVESDREQQRRYMLLLAEHHDSIASLLRSGKVRQDLVADALSSIAKSLRRKAGEIVVVPET
jgi:hypothetical protein